MTSSVSWMSFDAEQQRRTQLMMAALSEQGTIDELGLGVVRDLVAASVLPGIVNPMVRAKYLLLVPRDYRLVTGQSSEAVLDHGRRLEARRVRDLKRAHDGDVSGQGIIGARTGVDTRRMASSIYWGLLQQLEILKDSSLSLTDYCRLVAQHAGHQRARTTLTSEDDVADDGPILWAELPPESTEPLGLDLDLNEAEWLRDRFLATERRDPEHHSLMTWHLIPGRSWTPVDAPWDHPLVEDYPVGTREAVMLGRDLDAAIHGARILYNYLGALRRPDHGDERDKQLEHYATAMAEWHETALPSAGRITALDDWGRRLLRERGAGEATRFRWSQTLRFVHAWRDIAASSTDVVQDAAAAELVTRREALLKGGRARLTRPDELRNWQGGVSYGRFTYNWSIARRFLDDIHRGLGTPVVEVAA